MRKFIFHLYGIIRTELLHNFKGSKIYPLMQIDMEVYHGIAIKGILN